jgi:hypothetical protein
MTNRINLQILTPNHRPRRLSDLLRCRAIYIGRDRPELISYVEEVTALHIRRSAVFHGQLYNLYSYHSVGHYR